MEKYALEVIYLNLENLWLLFLTKRIFVKLALTVKIGIKYSYQKNVSLSARHIFYEKLSFNKTNTILCKRLEIYPKTFTVNNASFQW